ASSDGWQFMQRELFNTLYTDMKAFTEPTLSLGNVVDTGLAGFSTLNDCIITTAINNTMAR
ncbi:MAG: hypothetical protein ABI203_04640, partial [Mucilaginibacter sp.]